MTKPGRNICREFSPVETMTPSQLAARVIELEFGRTAHLEFVRELIDRNKRLRAGLRRYAAQRIVTRIERGIE